MTVFRLKRLFPLFLLLSLAACVSRPPSLPHLTLAPADFADLSHWNTDHVAAALAAFVKSCAALERRGDAARMGPATLHLTVADWRPACAAAVRTPANDSSARAFFERYFAPYLVGNNGVSDGLFTGYYEPLLHGARRRYGPYQTPILRRPRDLVMVDLGRFRPAWHGERIAGRVIDGNLVPYASRAAIVDGALDDRRLALFWVNNPVDAFFLQIQGSGRVELPDGKMVQLGYAGQNGWPYVPIGRILIQRGVLTRETVSLQSIRAWIEAHPREGAALMNENPSYVFFRKMSGPGPIGAEGVVLTAGRSLAVDPNFIPLGAPLFLEASDNGESLHRLMIAQDTGGAIGGPVRGDVFWGFGKAAAARAGAMKARGRYYLFLPKTVAPAPVVALRGN